MNIYLVNQIDTNLYKIGRFYNILPGGYCNWHTLTSEAAEELKLKISNSLKGRKHSEKTKEQMSKTHLGKPKSTEHCSNISKSKIGHKYNVGRECTEETKVKISKSNTGKKRSEQHIQYLKNRIITNETKKKMSEAQKGKKRSEETKKKMSETRKKNLRIKNENIFITTS